MPFVGLYDSPSLPLPVLSLSLSLIVLLFLFCLKGWTEARGGEGTLSFASTKTENTRDLLLSPLTPHWIRCTVVCLTSLEGHPVFGAGYTTPPADSLNAKRSFGQSGPCGHCPASAPSSGLFVMHFSSSLWSVSLKIKDIHKNLKSWSFHFLSSRWLSGDNNGSKW